MTKMRRLSKLNIDTDAKGRKENSTAAFSS